jgi:phospholipid/cholesterol/gamma-HCH transport system substrate-binding protein
MSRLRAVMGSRASRSLLAAVLVIAAIAVGLAVTRGPSSYRINAVYASAPGLFPGAAVDVLGVPVGTVTSVTNVADKVEVGMEVHSSARIPATADASLVAPELLGQPDVDLNPGYSGGAYLRPGATIAESHTSVPVSTDQLLKQLQRTLKELNPDAVGSLITNLSEDLDGQGAGLNRLIQSAAGTLQLLADKGADLGQLNGTLAQLTGTLDADTSQIEQLVRQYDTVSSVVAQHSGQLNSAITQLAGATTSLVTLLTPNLQPLEADVGTVTTVGRTLDRNLGNVDEVLQQANSLFEGTRRDFDPTYNWLDLNLAIAPGVTGDYVVGLIRDRLAGVCRRIGANHAAGLSAATLASLASCGNPNSTFFDPLINDIPGILGTLSGSSGSAAGTALLQEDLDQIGNIGAASSAGPGSSTGAAQGGTSSTGTSGTGTSGSGTSGSGTSGSPAPSTSTTTTTPPSSCGLLGTILGCPGGSSTPTTTTTPTPTTTPTSGPTTTTTTSSGLGGLLSEDVQATKATHRPTAQLASVASSGPSLSAPAARLLPPMPSAHHHRRAHAGLLDQWAHDVRNWL